MKWYLISEDTVKILQQTFDGIIKETDDQCSRTGCCCDVMNNRCSQPFRNTLHELDSGLHTTNEIPDDFK